MNDQLILCVNAGSSSLKLALFSGSEKALWRGAVDRIGQSDAKLTVQVLDQDKQAKPVETTDHRTAMKVLAELAREQIGNQPLAAVAHRLVHGGPKFNRPVRITPEVIEELHQLIIFDPQHLPLEIELVGAMQAAFPDTAQVACFDTSFHHDLPKVAQLLPIPRKYYDEGLRRYGFHGLSYASVMRQLKQTGPGESDGRVIIAHLGSGASLAAISYGHPIDTTMALTPASGVPMSTRSGDVDPGLELFLAKNHHVNAEAFNDMVNYKSGLLGLSETTADMEQLLKTEDDDKRAAEAVAVFCYNVKKAIGALAAAMGGLDTLVFTGGMGEAAPKIRARVCEGLEFLGIELDEQPNTNAQDIISSKEGRIKVRIIAADEAWSMAQDAWQILNLEAA